MKKSLIPRNVLRHDLLGAAGVFLLASAFLWWLAGQRLVWIIDEGIYLEGARRILAGQIPYRDFFVLTGPGTFWNVAASFKIFGISLASARALLVLDLSLIPPGWGDPDLLMRSLELFGTKVLPRIREI